MSRDSSAPKPLEATESHVNLNDWQMAHIKAALAEDEEGTPGVPHEEVMEWVASWGTDHELPRPTPRKL